MLTPFPSAQHHPAILPRSKTNAHPRFRMYSDGSTRTLHNLLHGLSFPHERLLVGCDGIGNGVDDRWCRASKCPLAMQEVLGFRR